MATEEEHEKWFIELPIEKCIELLRVRTDKFIGNESTIDGYDGWLNYFKTLPITEIKRLMTDGKESLTTEAYAALVRWADIIDTPSRIDKIYQAGLAKPKNDKKSISELASANDKLGVLYAIRDEIAEKLDRGTGARDTASLAKEMANIMDLITEAERRQGPSKDTKLAELLNTAPPKRTRGKGARNTSYMSRTIKETEGA